MRTMGHFLGNYLSHWKFISHANSTLLTEELLYKKREDSLLKSIKNSYSGAKRIPYMLAILYPLLNYPAVRPFTTVNMVPLNMVSKNM